MRSLIVAFPAILCLCCISCKQSPEQKLLGRWQEAAIINPQLDATMHDQGVFADTVGATTDSTQNQMLYGTDNIDTFRARTKANLDSFRKEQARAIAATIFDFQKDGLVFIHSTDGIDSAKWYIDEDGALLLDEEKLKGSGGKIRMEVLEASDTLLKLRYNEKYLSSTILFKPVKK